MNHEEKLYNSFRIAKSDILDNQKRINLLSLKVMELTESLAIIREDYNLLVDMVYSKLEEIERKQIKFKQGSETKNASKKQVNKNTNKKKNQTKRKYGISNQHIVPREKGWALLSANAKKANKIFSTKQKAVKKGTKLAKQGKVCLVVHNKNGKITKRDCR